MIRQFVKNKATALQHFGGLALVFTPSFHSYPVKIRRCSMHFNYISVVNNSQWLQFIGQIEETPNGCMLIRISSVLEKTWGCTSVWPSLHYQQTHKFWELGLLVRPSFLLTHSLEQLKWGSDIWPIKLASKKRVCCESQTYSSIW